MINLAIKPLKDDRKPRLIVKLVIVPYNEFTVLSLGRKSHFVFTDCDENTH